MSQLADQTGVVVEELSAEQGAAMFDHATRSRLGVSGEHFLQCYDAGIYPGEWSAEDVLRVEFLLPFAR